MSIAPISESAARVITSTLALHDAISVVKELLDNALDSKANNIAIEVSQNALDIIQVKDNGSAILQQDRKYLCKRGYTSKIRTIDDLAQLGGTFLGFRGEALASIAQLSKTTTITTRVDGEVAATALIYDSQGNLISSSPASHATGTTVRVTDFLYNIPVRRESGLKRSTRTLGGIQKLLSDYAFARPTIKFQLKVLKAPKDKANWLYSPSRNEDDLAEIVKKVVGLEVASQCRLQTIVSGDELYRIDAFLAARDCDVQKLGGAGQFTSLDGRPITTQRGFMKELCKMYRSYLHVTSHDQTLPLKPFLFLRLQCPRGSYDVNVEPAKNEVLFEDQASVLDLFETLCRRVYGEKPTETPAAKLNPRPALHSLANFDLLLADKSAQTIPATDTNTNLGLYEDNAIEPDDTARRVLSNLGHGNIEADSVALVTGDSRGLVEEENVMDPRVTNPFTLAKFTTRVPARKSTDQLVMLAVADTSSSAFQSGIQPSLLHNDFFEVRRRSRSPQDAGRVGLPQPDPAIDPQQSLVDTWKQSVSSQLSRLPTSDDSTTENTLSATRTQLQPRQSLTPPSARSTNPSPRPNAMRKPFRTPFKKPTGHPLSSRTEAALEFADGQTLLPTPSPTPRPQGPQLPGFRHPLHAQNDAELAEIMDFEHRKRNTINQHREHVRQTQSKLQFHDGNDTDSRVLSSSSDPHAMPSTQDSMHRYARELELDATQPDEDDDIPPQPNSAGYTQNPHWNRYRKAVRELDGPHSHHSTTSKDTRLHAHPSSPNNDLTTTSRRPKTSTLHKRLGNVDARDVTQGVIASLAQQTAHGRHSNDIDEISRTAALLDSVDRYIRSGYKHDGTALLFDHAGRDKSRDADEIVAGNGDEDGSISYEREALEDTLRDLLKRSIVRRHELEYRRGDEMLDTAAVVEAIGAVQFDLEQRRG